MSLPTYIFLDTNVFDSQNYNFASVALKTFSEAVQARAGITLLIPDPVEREVRRHILERSAQALKALNEARRSAPFLAKWEHYPKVAFPDAADWEVTRLAMNEWHQFIKRFSVKKLGYQGVDPATVMAWYDKGKPPFNSRKKFEFPDAFVVAILDKFVADNTCTVAVVSQDGDMRLACKERPAFLHFENLPQLTEMLVAGDGKVDELRDAILTNTELLIDAVTNELGDVQFYHDDSDYEIEDTDWEDITITDVRIVGLAHGEAILAFEMRIDTRLYLKWKEQEDEDVWVLQRGRVRDISEIKGTAKALLDPKTKAITAVPAVELDQYEVKVTETPW